MYTATWNGKVIAKSDKTVEIEGNQYFPLDSVTDGLPHGFPNADELPVEGNRKLFQPKC